MFHDDPVLTAILVTLGTMFGAGLLYLTWPLGAILVIVYGAFVAWSWWLARRLSLWLTGQW